MGDVLIATNAYLGPGTSYTYNAKVSLPGIVLTSRNRLYFPYMKSSAPTAHVAAYSDDYGETWGTETLQSFSGTSYPVAGGYQCHMNPAGTKVFAVCPSAYYSSPRTLARIDVYARSATGIWTTHQAPIGARDFYSQYFWVKSYWRQGAGGTDEIVVAWSEYYLAKKIYMIVWNSSTGWGSEIDVISVAGSPAVEFSGGSTYPGAFSLVPHPTTYEPIIAYCTMNMKYRIETLLRNTNGTWTIFPELSNTLADYINPQLYVRRSAQGGTYELELLYQRSFYTAVPYIIRLDLDTGLWGTTFTPPPGVSKSNGLGSAYMESNRSTPANEDNDRYYVHAFGTTIAVEGGSNWSSTYVVSNAGSTVYGVLTPYYPGPDGLSLFPHNRFVSGFAFVYNPGSNVRFYSYPGTVWNKWETPFSIFTSQQIRESLVLGITININGSDLTEDGTEIALPTRNSTFNHVYQKIGFRNDTAESGYVTVRFNSSAGTPLMTYATAGQTEAEARLLDYGYNQIDLDLGRIEPGSTAYAWVRWTPPANYQTVPVGTVTHRILRVFR
jgi:hypothetical protein